VALFPLPLSHELPCFPTLKMYSLHLMIFRHLYFIHMKSDHGNFWCYELSTSFPSHLSFSFPLDEIFGEFGESNENVGFES
jgi:hypothetical protein